MEGQEIHAEFHNPISSRASHEDLGATPSGAARQATLWPGARFDGVFGLWYGKGPGVDRSGDVFKHANFAGTARHGGVLALAGDDHACKSSTVPHQSEHAFVAAMIPVLNPSNVQEFLDLGLYGWALSRFAGLWVGFKTIADTVDSSASVQVDPHRVDIRVPEIDLPEGGLGIRWPDPPMVQEERLMRHKLYAALAFARENRLDRTVWGAGADRAEDRRIGIVTTGKSYLDTRQALEDLGIPEERARAMGISIYKVAMPWPLEPQGVRAFAEGLDELIVIEEKRALIENQLKEQLYNWQADRRPVIVGKFDEERNWILPSTGELAPSQIAVVVGKRLLEKDRRHRDRLSACASWRKKGERRRWSPPQERSTASPGTGYLAGPTQHLVIRGCRGSRAAEGGTSAHILLVDLGWAAAPNVQFQMGAKAPPGDRPSSPSVEPAARGSLISGDGTHVLTPASWTVLALDCGPASNLTYKILYNDAVAMTGGQPGRDGTSSVPYDRQPSSRRRASSARSWVSTSGEVRHLSGLPHGTAGGASRRPRPRPAG